MIFTPTWTLNHNHIHTLEHQTTTIYSAIICRVTQMRFNMGYNRFVANIALETEWPIIIHNHFLVTKVHMPAANSYVEYFSPQVLVLEDQPATELHWVSSNWSQIPYGAVVTGHKTGGVPLYVAQIYEESNFKNWYAGNYDPDKHCAEYLLYVRGVDPTILCGAIWKLLVIKYGMWTSIFSLLIYAHRPKCNWSSLHNLFTEYFAFLICIVPLHMFVKHLSQTVSYSSHNLHNEKQKIQIKTHNT